MDVEADWRGDASEVVIRKTIFFTQLLVYASFFACTAYDANVRGGRAQQLSLNDGVISVAAGHDAGVVVSGDGDGVADMIEVDQQDVFCIREKRFLCKFFAVVHGNATKANVTQDWHQLLSNMAAAKNINTTSTVNLFNIISLAFHFY